MTTPWKFLVPGYVQSSCFFISSVDHWGKKQKKEREIGLGSGVRCIATKLHKQVWAECCNCNRWHLSFKEGFFLNEMQLWLKLNVYNRESMSQQRNVKTKLVKKLGSVWKSLRRGISYNVWTDNFLHKQKQRIFHIKRNITFPILCLNRGLFFQMYYCQLWRVKKVQLTGNNFTQKGLHDLTRRLGDVEDKKVNIMIMLTMTKMKIWLLIQELNSF